MVERRRGAIVSASAVDGGTEMEDRSRTAGEFSVPTKAILCLWFALQVSAWCVISRPAYCLNAFTVSDSVKFAYFGNLWSTLPWYGGADGVTSPDGRYYARIASRADLRHGCIRSTVWLIDIEATEDYLKGQRGTVLPTPRPLATLCDAGGDNNVDLGAEYVGETIDQLTWGRYGRALAFLGSHDSGIRSVFSVSLTTGAINRVTPANQNVISYQWQNGRWVYLTRPAQRDHSETWLSVGDSIPNVQMITGQSLIEALYPRAVQHLGLTTAGELWQVVRGRAQPVLDSGSHHVITIPLAVSSARPALSSTGSEVVISAYATTVPNEWRRYYAGPQFSGLLGELKRGSKRDAEVTRYGGHFASLLEYLSVNLGTGKVKPLLDAPEANFGMGWSAAGAQIAAWSTDGTRVAVVYTYMPAAWQANHQAWLSRPCIVAVVSVKSDDGTCVWAYSRAMRGRFPSIYDIDWKQGDSELFVTVHTDPSQADEVHADEIRVYKSSAGGWRALRTLRGCVASATRAGGGGGVAMGVRQGLNEPPTLTAMDCASGRTVKVLDPNPWLRTVAFGAATVYTWGSKNEYSGLLIRPPNFMNGRRYPLVIQTHGFMPGQFVNTGYLTTGGAARALTGQGIVVLQVREAEDKLNTIGETSEMVHEYLGAVTSLVRMGVVDRSRVGITGFSRTGVYVAAAITRYPKQFAAAVLTNTEPGTMFGYLTFVDFGGSEYRKDFANVVGAGAPPWGLGLQRWIKQAPGFSSDEVRAAVLFSAGDPQHLIGLWGFYAALKDEGKPVEFQYIRDGQHMLTRPEDRLAQQQKIVEWYDFWLKGIRSGVAASRAAR